jgi:uncharacterized membrane protein (UPF0127 family)
VSRRGASRHTGAVFRLFPRALLAFVAFVLVGCVALQPLRPQAKTSSPPVQSSLTVAAEGTAGRNQLFIRKHDGTTVTLVVEVAATPASQATGLSGRTSLAPDAGMLFVFPTPQPTEFWMRDTLIPLSIAFVDDSRTIVSIQEMQAETDQHHVPPGPIRYAIEANQGFFSRAGVAIGDVVDLGGVRDLPTPVSRQP